MKEWREKKREKEREREKGKGKRGKGKGEEDGLFFSPFSLLSSSLLSISYVYQRETKKWGMQSEWARERRMG